MHSFCNTILLSVVIGLTYLQTASAQAPTDRLKAMLKRFPQADTNKDGVLSQAEWRKFAEQLRKERDGQLDEYLKRFPQADTDRDGKLSREEFQQFQAKRRERLAKATQQRKAWLQKNPRTKKDVKYGPHERNVLDFWQAEGTDPRPLVIFIHGGGWVGGSKDRVPTGDVERLRNAGISVASISYRYSTIKPFPTPLRDAGLAVQYLRHHAKEYQIDPKRIACYGGSAGATSSLWLAFHDDMADPQASDPVLRESTRLTCAGAYAAPTSLDKKTMDDWFGMKVAVHPAMFPFFNVKTEEELYSAAVRQMAAEASPVNHLSEDDPPVYLNYAGREKPLQAKHTPGQMVHHALFGKKLKDAARKFGVKVTVNTSEPEFQQKQDMIAFLIEHLK